MEQLSNRIPDTATALALLQLQQQQQQQNLLQPPQTAQFSRQSSVNVLGEMTSPSVRPDTIGKVHVFCTNYVQLVIVPVPHMVATSLNLFAQCRSVPSENVTIMKSRMSLMWILLGRVC